MKVGEWLLWGFAATVVLTAFMAASQAFRLTRMNIPYMLGTMLTADRDRARIFGILLHLMNGWLFSLIYVAAFHSVGLANWWLGAAIGLVHAAFVLMVALPALPGIHPRMASETHGPTMVKQLQPPGFFGKHYGLRTPVSVLLAHLIFGMMLGGFYDMS